MRIKTAKDRPQCYNLGKYRHIVLSWVLYLWFNHPCTWGWHLLCRNVLQSATCGKNFYLAFYFNVPKQSAPSYAHVPHYVQMVVRSCDKTLLSSWYNIIILLFLNHDTQINSIFQKVTAFSVLYQIFFHNSIHSVTN